MMEGRGVGLGLSRRSGGWATDVGRQETDGFGFEEVHRTDWDFFHVNNRLIRLGAWHGGEVGFFVRPPTNIQYLPCPVSPRLRHPSSCYRTVYCALRPSASTAALAELHWQVDTRKAAKVPQPIHQLRTARFVVVVVVVVAHCRWAILSHHRLRFHRRLQGPGGWALAGPTDVLTDR